MTLPPPPPPPSTSTDNLHRLVGSMERITQRWCDDAEAAPKPPAISEIADVTLAVRRIAALHRDIYRIENPGAHLPREKSSNPQPTPTQSAYGSASSGPKRAWTVCKGLPGHEPDGGTDTNASTNPADELLNDPSFATISAMYYELMRSRRDGLAARVPEHLLPAEFERLDIANPAAPQNVQVLFMGAHVAADLAVQFKKTIREVLSISATNPIISPTRDQNHDLDLEPEPAPESDSTPESDSAPDPIADLKPDPQPQSPSATSAPLRKSSSTSTSSAPPVSSVPSVSSVSSVPSVGSVPPCENLPHPSAPSAALRESSSSPRSSPHSPYLAHSTPIRAGPSTF